MIYKIAQKQSRDLLFEHAKSSMNFYWIGRFEWIIAITFVVIGIIILIASKSVNYFGILWISIGCYELLKFPTREKRWVAKKKIEKKFDTEILFEIDETGLKVKIDTSEKDKEEIYKYEMTHKFSKMRACLISDTGILFKISYLEYYYISFKTIEKKYSVPSVVKFLKTHFNGRKFRLKPYQRLEQI